MIPRESIPCCKIDGNETLRMSFSFSDATPASKENFERGTVAIKFVNTIIIERACEIIVAIAAPFTPKPKIQINTKSSKMLHIVLESNAIKVILEFPIACVIAMP